MNKYLIALLVSLLVLDGLLLTKVNFTTYPPNIKNETPVLDASENASESLPVTTIKFTGDIMLGRSVMKTMKDLKDFSYPFHYVAAELNNADITIVNLENPVVTNCPEHTSGFTFCTSPEAAAGLAYAGIDMVSLANNHSRNYGNIGLTETIDFLSAYEIKSTGVGELETIEKNGITFGFLGFDYVTPNSAAKDIELVKNSDKQVDVLIVSPHWGVEYKAKANDWQRDKARELIVAGADIVVGHHPHWVQDADCFTRSDASPSVLENIPADLLVQGTVCPNETIPVYYSLGNFVFDQMWSEETKKGAILKLTFDNSNIIEQEITATYIEKLGQPVLK